MNADWPVVNLSECASFQEGYVNPTQKKPEYFDGDVKWLRAVDLNNSYVKDTTRTLTKSGFESAGKSALLFEPGTLAISKSGTIGRIGILEDYMCGNRAVINIKVDDSKCNNRFIFYVLLSNRAIIENLAIGSVQKNLYTSALGSLEFKLPPREIQDVVAETLMSLDDKIELNRQTNQTLEHIAQAIFKCWFVDFEPTRAKIIAKEKGANSAIQELAAQAIICGAMTLEQLEAITQNLETTLQQAINEKLSQANQTPINTEQLKTTAALFPNALVESELGEIPEGWEASTLGENFDVVMGQSPKGDTYNEEGEGMLFFQGRRDFGFRYPAPRVYTTEPKRLAQSGDTLISVRAPVGDRNMANQECCLGRGVAGIRHKSGARSFTYAFIGHIENKLGDSGSAGTVFSSINKNELAKVSFVKPIDELLQNFEKKVFSIDQKIEVLSNEIDTLENLRDGLLPKLLSGVVGLNGRGE